MYVKNFGSGPGGFYYEGYLYKTEEGITTKQSLTDFETPFTQPKHQPISTSTFASGSMYPLKEPYLYPLESNSQDSRPCLLASSTWHLGVSKRKSGGLSADPEASKGFGTPVEIVISAPYYWDYR